MTNRDRDEGQIQQQVRNYVSGRMSSDLPPDFVRDVMHEVRDTRQRNRWSGWPLVAGLASVAAAVALVGIGLSVINGPNVGDGPSSSAQPSPTESASVSSSQTPSAEPVASATEPAVETLPAPSGEAGGAFGPTWQLDPGEAFGEPATCENEAALPTAEQGGFGYRISYPADWYANEFGSYISQCMLFGPQQFEAPYGTVPEEAVIVIDVESGGSFVPGQRGRHGGEIVRTDAYTIAGLPAERHEIHLVVDGVVTERSIVWVIGVQGELPSDAIDSPAFVTISTTATGAGAFIQQADVLDHMAATFGLLE
jgi:hypothetical protein